MLDDLAGRAVIVTGGASHIGRAIVLAFAGSGAAVVLIDKDGEQAARTAALAVGKGAARADVVVADLLDPAEAARAVREAVGRLSGLDVLVNNVGGPVPAFFRQTSVAQWQAQLDLNLLTPIVATGVALETFVPQRSGSVVSVGSISAWGEPRTAVYGAAKAGLIAFMRTLAKEHGRDGIRFNTVAPGVVLPESADDLGAESIWSDPGQVWQNPDQLESIRRHIPLRKTSTPADVAEAVLFFASERSAGQLTGQVLSVSGGFHMTD
jgi:NAD(P)-dependent dehydrogenase (short-subunit alcohol dehydrogenase family)